MADVYVKHTITGLVQRVPEDYLDHPVLGQYFVLVDPADDYCADCGVTPPDEVVVEDAPAEDSDIPDAV